MKEAFQGDFLVLLMLILLMIGLFEAGDCGLGLCSRLGAPLLNSLAFSYCLLSSVSGCSPPFLAPFSSNGSTKILLLRLAFMISPSFSLSSELFVEYLALSNAIRRLR